MHRIRRNDRNSKKLKVDAIRVKVHDKCYKLRSYASFLNKKKKKEKKQRKNRGKSKHALISRYQIFVSRRFLIKIVSRFARLARYASPRILRFLFFFPYEDSNSRNPKLRWRCTHELRACIMPSVDTQPISCTNTLSNAY